MAFYVGLVMCHNMGDSEAVGEQLKKEGFSGGVGGIILGSFYEDVEAVLIAQGLLKSHRQIKEICIYRAVAFASTGTNKSKFPEF